MALPLPLLHIQGEFAANVGGGTPAAGAYAIRDLTAVVVSAITGSSISFTLALSTVTAGQTIILNGLTFTAHADTTTTANQEFDISGNDSADGDELVTVINDSTDGAPGITASNAAGTVTIKCEDIVMAPPTGTAVGDTATLTSLNKITLPAGTYFCDALAQAHRAGACKSLLWNDTDGVFLLIGNNNYSRATSVISANCPVRGRFTLAAEKEIELQTWFQVDTADGLGFAMNDGQVEVYSDILIWEINGDELNSAHWQEQKATTEAAGGTTGGTFHVRVLDTELHNTITGASLASNQITLAAGTYEIDATAMGFDRGLNNLNLYDTTASAYIELGSCVSTSVSVNTGHMMRCIGRFTLTAESVLELRDFTNSTKATDGLGVPTSDGEIEVYCDVHITDVG
ncbi:MAG: hypothetical protein V3V96_15410 [Acidiferrobacterales bacterium]